MDKIIARIDEQNFTTREYFFMGISIFLIGTIVGLIFSPKRAKVVGSNNGNNNMGFMPMKKPHEKERN